MYYLSQQSKQRGKMSFKWTYYTKSSFVIDILVIKIFELFTGTKNHLKILFKIFRQYSLFSTILIISLGLQF